MDLKRWRDLGTDERRLVALVVAGLTDEEIAVRARVSPAEVASQLRRLFDKLDVTSRTQLVIQSALAAPGLGAGADTPPEPGNGILAG